MNKEFLKMQKLAGVITEGQYNEKKSLIENQEELTPEKAADSAEKAADDLADNPEQIKQALTKAKQAGINLDLVKQAAEQLKQGKSYEDVIKSIAPKVQENLNEISATNFRRNEKVKSTLLGGGVGAFISLFPSFGAWTAGAAGLAAEAAPSEWLIAMGVVALAGAALGYHFRDRDSGGKVNSYDIALKAAWEFKNQMVKQGRSNTLPDVNLFYIVDNGETPKELNGKEIWRFKIADRDVVGDKEALWKSKEAFYNSYAQP